VYVTNNENEQELEKQTKIIMGIRNVLYKKAKIIKELTFKGNIKIAMYWKLRATGQN
jgi:hypothetical protein